MRKESIGFIWSLTSAFLWSTTFISSRFLISKSYIDPVTLSSIRYLVGGLILMIIGIVFNKKQLFSVTFKEIGFLSILALFGVCGMSTLLFWGQKYTTATNSSLIMQLNPVIISILGVFVGEKVGLKKIEGLFISLLGCLIVVEVITVKGVMFRFQDGFGNFLVFFAALCWAVYSILVRGMVSKHGGLVTTAWLMMLGSAELFLAKLILPIDTVFVQNGFTWGIILYIAVFPTALAFFAWNEAMNKISLSLLNIMQYLTPLFTILLAALLLKERLGMAHIIGILLIMVGIFISEFIKGPKSNQHMLQ